MTRRMPGLHASAAHWVAQYEQQSREMLPYPDRPYWFHAVIGAEPDSMRALQEVSSGPAGLLPAVHPDLHQYVPKGCSFSIVPADAANSVFDVEHARLDSNDERFFVEEIVVPSDCDLRGCAGRRSVALRGGGHEGL